MNMNGTTYHSDTPIKMVELLERLRNDQTRVRFHWGDTTNGEDWGDMYGVEGRIGRSTGTVKVPLLIHNKRSSGGRAILDHCIVKITTTNGRRTIYQHPDYHTKEVA